MSFLQWTLYQNTLREWLLAFAIAVVVFVLGRLLKAGATRRLGRFATRTRNELDDLLAAVLARTRLFFLVVIGVLCGAYFLILPPQAAALVSYAAVLSLIVQVGIWGNAAIGFYVDRQVRRRLEEDAAGATTLNALGFLGRLLLWAVLVLVALDNLGVDITALVAGLGIGGVAVALAVQNILGDLFASLSIVLDKPFVIGDFIIVGDLLGTVEHIGLKTTRVRSLSGEQIIFSNADLLQSRVRNFKRMYERRVVVTIGVIYGTDEARLREIPGLIRSAIEARQKTRFDRAHFKGYGASSLDFEYVYYVLDSDYNVYMDVQQEINLEIYRRFAERGLEFAFPTHTVHLQHAETAVEPAARR